MTYYLFVRLSFVYLFMCVCKCHVYVYVCVLILLLIDIFTHLIKLLIFLYFRLLYYNVDKIIILFELLIYFFANCGFSTFRHTNIFIYFYGVILFKEFFQCLLLSINYYCHDKQCIIFFLSSK